MKILLIEEPVTGFRNVPYGDVTLAKKGRRHVADLTRVPCLHEKMMIAVQDDTTGSAIAPALFQVCQPPTHLDPGAWTLDLSHVVAVLHVHRVTE